MAWILHSDINSAYASIELVYRPEIRNKPVVVGGDEEARHGIVLAKNLLAKKHGIKTGNSLMDVRRLCPGVIVLPPNYPLYLKTSRLIREIYREYTDRVEPFGLDECWLDISDIASNESNALLMADEIRERIYKELGLTVSIGVSWNKPFAKLGSDLQKPYGLVSITKENYKNVVWPLPASELLNVGSARRAALERRCIYTIGDIAMAGKERLRSIFGVVGEMLWVFASGNDVTPVISAGEEQIIKSIGNSYTFPRDLVCDEDVKIGFYVLAESVSARLRENGFDCGTIQISLRDNSLLSFERQMKLESPTMITSELVDSAMALFKKSYDWRQPLRSIGLRGTGLSPMGADRQLTLFCDEEKRNKRIILENTIDNIRERFGYFQIQRGILLIDKALSSLDARKDNTIHPVGYQYTG